ncbi:MAG: RIP metalloprotease RseP [Myxococcaceae bacterium]|nr:RIP metalloprotease RseP [Myxococcaceae bacterium]
MSSLFNLGSFVLFLGVLVTVHELGHFLVAKWCGVKVLKFSIGFGPRIVGFTRGETEYRIAWIPLGGYVRMAGEQAEDDVPPEDLKRSFSAQPPWKRGAIVIAGPAFNLIFPLVAYFFLYLGSTQVISPRVGAVVPGYPAARAGLKAGDLITRIDGKPVVAFRDVSVMLADSLDREVEVAVKRGGEDVTVRIAPRLATESDAVEKTTRGYLGIEARPRSPIVGVAAGSSAFAAGLRSFDRIARVDGVRVNDEQQLAAALAKAGPTVKLDVLRPRLVSLGTAAAEVHEQLSLEVPRQEGEGYAALGVEGAELYVWSVSPGSPAAQAGLMPGDRLVSLDGKPLTSWVMVSHELSAHDVKPFALTWRHGEEEKSATVVQAKAVSEDALKNRLERKELGVLPRQAFYDPESDLLAFGASYEVITIDVGPKDALAASARIVPTFARKIGLSLLGLFTGQVSMDSLGGPITLALVAAHSAERGIADYVATMAFISINLGLVNLLPIPVLDGFALLSAAWEAIRRRPIPVRAKEYANLAGLAILLLVMVRVFYNDITKHLLPDQAPEVEQVAPAPAKK